MFVAVGMYSGLGSYLYALDQATGRTHWRTRLNVSSITSAWAGISYDRGRIFDINDDGWLQAFDAKTGAQVWAVKLPDEYAFDASPTADGGIVYVSGSGIDGELYAVDESSGALLWETPVQNGQGSSPAVDAERVYVTYNLLYYAFDRFTGALAWLSCLDNICEGLGGGSTPVLADGHLYVRDADGDEKTVLSAATGAPQGLFGIQGTNEIVRAPAIAHGMAFEMVGRNTGTNAGLTLTAVRHDGLGQRAWSFRGDGSLSSTPVVIGDTVIVGSYRGNLYALDARRGPRARIWKTNVGQPIEPPDEYSGGEPWTGIGATSNRLLVPASSTLISYTTR